MALMGRAKNREVHYQFTSLGRVCMRKVWFHSFVYSYPVFPTPFIYLYSFLFGKIISCIYFWLCWAFVTPWAFLQLWGMETTLSLQCVGFSLWWLLLLLSTALGCLTLVVAARGSVVIAPGLQSTGSIAVVHGLSCSTWHEGSSQIRD